MLGVIDVFELVSLSELRHRSEEVPQRDDAAGPHGPYGDAQASARMQLFHIRMLDRMEIVPLFQRIFKAADVCPICLLYTSDAADE